MRAVRLLSAAATATVAALALIVTPAGAFATGHAVFAQNDSALGNTIVAYDRAQDGTLTQVGTYPTGGLGGTLEGSVVDHLASQSSLVFDQPDGLLFAVNAGSNTISVFAVIGDRLALHQVLSSGGAFPVSVAVDAGLVYVLNAEEGGTLQGFRVLGGRLAPLAASARSLGLNTAATPQFTNTPGQVAFSPDASQLLVTTKENGNAVDVFALNAGGRLSKAPFVNTIPGAVPFALAFDRQGHVVLTEAGPNAVASFELHENGELAQLDSVATGQKATCWIVRADDRFFVSNAGSGSLTAVRSEVGGQLLSAGADTGTDAGTVDAASTPGGRFLYVQTGAAGTLDEFAAEPGGALAKIGSVNVPEAVGGEGIVAG